MQPGLGWMSTVGLSSKILPKDELSWRSLPLRPLSVWNLIFSAFYQITGFFWLYNDLQISAVFVLTKWHYWSRRPGKSFLPVQNPCPCCRSWGIHPSPDLHPEGPCVHCQSGKSHTVHSICWDAPCCHTRRWYCYSTALASAACPDWWWRKYKKTIVQWVFSRSINCTPGCILLAFLAKKKRWVSKLTDLISSFLSDYWTLHLR